jgi:hypothetical protein
VWEPLRNTFSPSRATSGAQTSKSAQISSKTFILVPMTQQSPTTFAKLGINVLLLDPLPKGTLEVFENAGYTITEAFEPMTEGQLGTFI